MTTVLQTALAQWCGYALDVARLDQLHARAAMHDREALRAAAGELSDDDNAALTAADQLFAAAAATVVPLLKHAGWLDRRPAAHYAHQYAGQAQ